LPALQLDAAGKEAFHSGMKRILFSVLLAACAACAVTTNGRAQDAGAQQQLDKLYGQIQDLMAAQELQAKKLTALEKDIAELRDKVNTPAATPDNASRDDLKSLAEKVQEIDRKRQDDRQLILKEIDKLGRATAAAPAPRIKPAPVAPAAEETTAPAGPQKGYEYVVQAGDTIGLIAKAYREKGVKVTYPQILKANPGLDANKLYVGKKVFIPDPNAK
jgi:septal ring factor EnvC (AmiA/AmiB activator)/phage tail protein X